MAANLSLSILKKVAQVKIIRYSSSIAGFKPRRSLLYVPGDENKKVQKASGLDADVVVLDCEDGVAQSKKFKSKVNDLMKNHTNQSPLKVICQTETPIGMMNLRGILEECLIPDKNLQFEAFVFGSDDFLASIGGTRTESAIELLFARQNFIMHVKGFGLQAIDMVYINFKDQEGLERQSSDGAKMGFTGKQIIHPAQIDVVNKAFAPTEERIDYAERLVKAFDAHQLTGKGAFAFEGNMIDMPTVLQAQNILNLAKAIA
uniref:HpcH/HpaI aldolase/citrate lyase domain-containing protein n=1 Tax=Clytia hemisphaerica TaxID=252671 RepID=A0A7M6DRE8_9CNID